MDLIAEVTLAKICCNDLLKKGIFAPKKE